MMMMMMMNRRGTIWLQRLHSHHLHQSHGQHPIPRVGNIGIVTSTPSRKPFWEPKFHPNFEITNKPTSTTTSNNITTKQKKKNTELLFAMLPSTFPFSHFPFPASSPRRNVPAPHRRLPPWRNRPAGPPGPWPAPRGVPQHWARRRGRPVGQEDLAAAPTAVPGKLGDTGWWNKIRLTMLMLENIPIFHRVFIDHRWCRIVYLSVHVCQLCSC